MITAVLAVGATVVAGAAGAVPATAAPAAAPESLTRAVDLPPAAGSTAAKEGAQAEGALGAQDRELLAAAQRKGDATVRVMLVTDPERTGEVVEGLEALGATVGSRYDEVGYVRATVPTGAVERAAQLRDVVAVDLDQLLRVPQPAVERAGAAAAAAVAGPGPQTPDANPYMPTRETKAVTFKQQHPGWDGRGVTIGILDSGVDLDHPSLQTTSTGERKITDWVTATDPLVEGDASWRPMLTQVSGPTFTYQSATWTAPAGTYLVNRFAEGATAGSELGGDVNRDGDTNDFFGVLYRPSDHAIWVDVDQDNDFTDETLMRPYGEQYQVGHFGTDQPETGVREQVPFVVEYREDVDLGPAGLTGQSADFVNIGIVSSNHGSHVAGITAANAMFGGAMDGAAPGAKLVSSRACLLSGGCTAVALTEGMLDLAANRGVDVINMSIGGLPALNDGDNARAELYDRIIDQYGVQIVLSGGNSGPGLNTVGDPAVSSDALAVAASISRQTWKANYGSEVRAEQALFNFSSRGPSEAGDVKPDVAAPGSAISTVPLWQAGGPVAEAGYPLPAGYAMLNGTSMAAPQTAGAVALLLSGSYAKGLPVTPAQLRQALTSTARLIPGVGVDAQGSGLIDTNAAWRMLTQTVEVQGYEVSAPVCTALSENLREPGVGVGVYDRCSSGDGGAAPGATKTYTVEVTRTSGPAGKRVHDVSLVGSNGDFSTSVKKVRVARGETVAVDVTVRAREGAQSALLQLDDPATTGADARIMVSVIATAPLTGPGYSASASGAVDRNGTRSIFVDVPEGADVLQVDLGGVATGSQTRFIAFSPYGVPVESTSSLACYTRFSDPAACNPVTRAYQDPIPGIWEIEVESRRTSPFLENPYRVTATVEAVTVEPEEQTVEAGAVGTPVPLAWTVTNDLGPVTVTGQGGPLGSTREERPSIADGASQAYEVVVPAGATQMRAVIGNPSDLGADLDLTVFRDGVQVAQQADGDSEEAVTVNNPPAGTYRVVVDGYSVPAGTTEYDYLDVFTSPALGTLAVSGGAVELASGESAEFTGTLTPQAEPTEGRVLSGEARFRNESGAVLGTGRVVVGG
ncbi:S8 family serine peptidase [Vallicoccus soli]|uniref:S8 family serine peptidase n=1 Tax=Vallicoccus soli TaxID=2339232 RepID=UPI001C49B74D|nr:S8 family serine peptidase [Vallicoccus soli]